MSDSDEEELDKETLGRKVRVNDIDANFIRILMSGCGKAVTREVTRV